MFRNIFNMLKSSAQIGEMLRELREQKKLTQEDLAIKINKKRSYISRIENNRSNINIKTLQEIVEIGLEGSLMVEIK